MIQLLIEHGHRWSDILNYTLPQLRGFVKAITRQQAGRDAQWLSMMSMGTRGEPRQLEQALDQLNEQARS